MSNLTTRDAIFDMLLSKAMTKREMANRLNLSSKTVSNHLVDIHRDIANRNGHEFRGRRYVIFNDNGTSRKYRVLSASQLTSQVSLSGKTFRKTTRKRLSSQTYPSVIYQR